MAVARLALAEAGVGESATTAAEAALGDFARVRSATSIAPEMLAFKAEEASSGPE